MSQLFAPYRSPEYNALAYDSPEYNRAIGHFLDAVVDNGTPQEAYEVEHHLLERISGEETISPRLARLGAKALAVGQYGRQHEAHPPKDTTYRHAGLILQKTIDSIDDLQYRRLVKPEAYRTHRNLVGVLSETAIYTLLAYDNQMAHSLTGRQREIPVHYTLPATKNEDSGAFFYDEHHRTGFDFKLFTNNPGEQVIPMQVKTSEKGADSGKPYAPGIVTIALEEILHENKGVYHETKLARLLAQDAAGRYDRQAALDINTAVRNLDRAIIDKTTPAETGDEVHSSPTTP